VQDLSDHQLGDHSARSCLADEVGLVENAQGEAPEGFGILAKSQRALLRGHDQHVAVRDYSDGLSLKIGVLGTA
jgi:hypothetical protein